MNKDSRLGGFIVYQQDIQDHYSEEADQPSTGQLKQPTLRQRDPTHSTGTHTDKPLSNPKRNKVESYKRRLALNRVSAKKSRQRKKQRIGTLEDRVAQLQLELAQRRQEVCMARTRMQKYLAENNRNDGYSMSRRLCYDRLEKAVQDESCVDDEEVVMLLDALKHKVGASGVERSGTINYYLKQFVHICIPPLQRYLMWVAEQESLGLGKSVEETKWVKDLRTSLQLTDLQQNSIALMNSTVCRPIGMQIEQLISQMQNIKKVLDSHGQDIEDTVDQLRRLATPFQLAIGISAIERNRFGARLSAWTQASLKFLEECNPASTLN